MFTQPERAAEELRSVLPSTVVKRLEWSTLKLEPGSRVDATLQERHTDLLFSVDSLSGTPSFLYLLFEHQSTPRSADAVSIARLHGPHLGEVAR